MLQEQEQAGLGNVPETRTRSEGGGDWERGEREASGLDATGLSHRMGM